MIHQFKGENQLNKWLPGYGFPKEAPTPKMFAFIQVTRMWYMAAVRMALCVDFLCQQRK